MFRIKLAYKRGWKKSGLKQPQLFLDPLQLKCDVEWKIHVTDLRETCAACSRINVFDKLPQQILKSV